MTPNTTTDTFKLGDRIVDRIGYGAMQLAGPGVFGPPKDKDTAIAVLREAISRGVDHIDTSDFYGPHVTNQLIREALYPYTTDLVIVTKVGAVRGADASWNQAMGPEEIRNRPETPASAPKTVMPVHLHPQNPLSEYSERGFISIRFA